MLPATSLALDLRSYVRNAKHGLATKDDFLSLLRFIAVRARLRRSTAVLLVKSGKAQTLTFHDFLSRFIPHVDALVHAIHRYARANTHTAFPDTALLYTTRDEPICLKAGPTVLACSRLPIFSHHKAYTWQTKSTFALDVLVPNLVHTQEYLVWYPPQDKALRALLRAGLYQMMSPMCCRWQLAVRSMRMGPQGVIDAGIVTSQWARPVPMVPFLDMPAHSRWRFLITCDGNSASARFGKLLSINSVVLKQNSPYLEWYYRSLVPGVHYVPFRVMNITEILRDCQGWSEERYQSMVTEANYFAYRYLGTSSRVAYWREEAMRYAAWHGRYGISVWVVHICLGRFMTSFMASAAAAGSAEE